jgi:ribose transport system permease protein
MPGINCRTMRKLLEGLQRYQGLVGLLLLFTVGAILTPGTFYSDRNLANILGQLAVPGILAVGMTFVILTGGIDLSIGSLLALLNCIVAKWIVAETGVGPTSAYVLLVGTAIGALLGFLVSVTRMQPFIVTLAAMATLRGVAYIYTDRGTVSGLGKKLQFLQDPIAGIPVSAWLMLAVTALAGFILNRTVFGRNVYAVGGNEEAARYAGISTGSVRVAAYGINGFCVGLAALLYTARNTNGDPSTGIGFELDAITAVVVGGTSLLGGAGGIFGTFVGGLFIVCLNVLLILKSVDTWVGQGFKGVIIFIAVYLQNLNRRS